MSAQCTFLAFTDLHHSPGSFPDDKTWRLETIYHRALWEQVDFAAFLGDLLHDYEKHAWFAEKYRSLPLPLYGAFGNHDTDAEDPAVVQQYLNIPHNYYFFDRCGYRFLVLDANYCLVGGDAIHYGPNQPRPHNRGYIPQEELAWLDDALQASPSPCVLLSHHSLERTDGILNRDEVWRIIAKANRARPQKVILAINGHYHCDACGFVNDVCCLDLNSASYHWTDVTNSLYAPEAYEASKLLNHLLCYDTPLSAVITLKGTETIEIRGCGGDFLGLPDAEEVKRLDQRRPSLSRLAVPYIRDYAIDLKRCTVAASPPLRENK